MKDFIDELKIVSRYQEFILAIAWLAMTITWICYGILWGDWKDYFIAVLCFGSMCHHLKDLSDRRLKELESTPQ